MKKLIFIRHGAVPGNLERRYIGRTDEALSKEGISQMLSLKERQINADVIFVSPMRRAVQSARLLFPDRELQIIDAFKETDFGIFEGKTADELADDEAYTEWVNSGCTADIPEGESVTGFKERCCRAFESLMPLFEDGKTYAFVVHGGVIMAIMERFLVPHHDFYHYHIKNGGMITAQVNGSDLIPL